MLFIWLNLPDHEFTPWFFKKKIFFNQIKTNNKFLEKKLGKFKIPSFKIGCLIP